MVHLHTTTKDLAMGANRLQGKITYINHDKRYAMLEYEAGGKKRVVKMLIGKTENKSSHFSSGDVVEFTLTHIKGTDRQEATEVTFKYNTALDVVLQKAKENNSFLGYLKQVGDDYFIKEINSYLFFKLQISKWQIEPAENDVNEPVAFYFEDFTKKEKLMAVLFDNEYVPEYLKAVKMFKAQKPVPATVTKVMPHAIYVDIVGDVITGKLQNNREVQIGDTVDIHITHLGKNKIAIEFASEDA